MKLVTTAEVFLKALKDGMKVEKRQSIPVLQYVKVNADNPSIITTDLDNATIIGMDGEGEGEALIPYHAAIGVLTGEKGKLVIETIFPEPTPEPVETPAETPAEVETAPEPQSETPAESNPGAAPDSEATEEMEETESKPVWEPVPTIRFTVNGCEYEFAGMRLSRFPELPTADGPAGCIPGPAFKELLERTSFAISREESRYTLNGALLILKGETARMVATDGHRLSLADVPGSEGDLQTLIPQSTIAYLESKTGAESVYVMTGESHISFAMGNKQIISRKLSGNFPNYEAVMPRAFTVTYPIDSPAAIAKTLCRVAKCADERSGAVRWDMNPSGPEIRAESAGMGKAKAQLPGIVIPIATETAGEETGDPETVISIGFNSAYIAEFLRIAGDEPVSMNLRDSQTAAMFSTNQDNGHTWNYVLMPMRV